MNATFESTSRHTFNQTIAEKACVFVTNRETEREIAKEYIYFYSQPKAENQNLNKVHKKWHWKEREREREERKKTSE